MKAVKKDILLAGKAAAGAAAAGMVKGCIMKDGDIGDFTFEDDDSIFIDHGTGTKLFLDKFSEDAMWQMMEELQIPERIRARGTHTDLRLSFDLSDPFVHKMYVHSSAAEEPLCELFLRVFTNLNNFHAIQDCPQIAEGAELLKSSLVTSHTGGDLRFLFAEWMLLQDPAAPLDGGHMLLPGQRFPGLGAANQFGELLLRLGKELSCDALINRPLYFHNALLYASTHAFLNPDVEGRFLAIVRDVLLDVKDRGLSTVSQGIRCGVLKHVPSDRVVTWVADEQARPISQRMKAFMESDQYIAIVKRHCPEMELFHLNMAAVFHSVHGRLMPSTSHGNLAPPRADRREPHPTASTSGDPTGERDHQESVLHLGTSDSDAAMDFRGHAKDTDKHEKGGGEGKASGKAKHLKWLGLGSLVHELVGRKSSQLQRGREDGGVLTLEKGEDSATGSISTESGLPKESEVMGVRSLDQELSKGKGESVLFAMDWDADLDDLSVIEARIKGGIPFREVDAEQ